MTGVDCLTASPGNGQSWYSLGDICCDGPCSDTERPGQRGRKAEGLVVEAVCGLAARTGPSEGAWEAAVVWTGRRTRWAFLGAGGRLQAVAVSTETRLPSPVQHRPGQARLHTEGQPGPWGCPHDVCRALSVCWLRPKVNKAKRLPFRQLNWGQAPRRSEVSWRSGGSGQR